MSVTYEPLTLLHAVRDIAELSAAPVPATVSTRAWDSARALSTRFADAPAARRITEQLGIPWSKVRELAFKPRRAQLTGLGHALNEREGNWLTREHCDFVLAVIARRLGVPTLTPSQYRTERDAMLAVPGSRADRLRMPTEDQIVALIGSWDRALAHAGLRARLKPGGSRARIKPVGIVDVLDRCYEHHQTEPTIGELEMFARANGIPSPRKERGRPFSSYVAEWKTNRRSLGQAVPDRPPPKAQRPDYSVDVGAALPGERRAKRRWDDIDEVIDWAMRFLSQLKSGQRATQRAYDRWARQQEGAPWSSVLDQHGGWDAVREQAHERLRAGAGR